MIKISNTRFLTILTVFLFCGTLLIAADYNVKDYGAKGDGKNIDSKAINKAIEAAAKAGGGTVFIPAGTYLSFSIRMQSNIGLFLDHGAVIVAASPEEHDGMYDEADPNEWDMYQDHGHSHWKNSLIWGIGLSDISISGFGKIYGKGLRRWDTVKVGVGNKAIAFKNCHNVTIQDISMQECGHFAIMPTGVDNFTISNLKIDTQRDAINIDCCKNVNIDNCFINTPNDDAIVIKSSYGLGYPRVTENVMISNCLVSGYDLTTFLDGTFKKTQQVVPDGGGPTGRIKLGTESNGGFKNITITNCTFEHCRGLALETVDGGILEDITISNITMNDIINAPIFLRLGRRMRAPEGTPIGSMKRIIISNVTVYKANPEFASLILGIEDHPIEDVQINNVIMYVDGGMPADYAEIEVPVLEDGYPDPRFFGEMPAYGFYVRHVDGIEFNNVQIKFKDTDYRPAFVLDKVKNVDFNNVKTNKVDDVPMFMLKDVENFKTRECKSAPDTDLESVDDKKL